MFCVTERVVGAGCRQEDARRRPGTGRYEVPDEQHGIAGQPPDFPEGLAHRRSSVLDAFTSAEAAIAAGEDLTPALRADMRVAAVSTTETATDCAEWAHLVAGTSSIRAHPPGARLPRHVRGNPARLHEREGGHLRGADMAGHNRRPARSVSRWHPLALFRAVPARPTTRALVWHGLAHLFGGRGIELRQATNRLGTMRKTTQSSLISSIAHKSDRGAAAP